jgi:hypothetical protein
MDIEIFKLFEIYNKSFDKLNGKLNEELPRSLRLFNIRLRLAIDIQVNFKGEVSLTKSKEVKDIYIKLIKLLEIWNAYEAFYHYLKETNKYVNVNESIYKKYSQTFLNEVGSLPVLKETIDQIKFKFLKDSTFKHDFNELINRIEKDDRIRENLTKSCKNILTYLDRNKNISGIEIIALIYAERNMYYHNGETAKMGMSYRNRQFLIQTLTTGFLKHILLLANWVLNNELESK